jgi:hypothetical protein
LTATSERKGDVAAAGRALVALYDRNGAKLETIPWVEWRNPKNGDVPRRGDGARAGGRPPASLVARSSFSYGLSAAGPQNTFTAIRVLSPEKSTPDTFGT